MFKVWGSELGLVGLRMSGSGIIRLGFMAEGLEIRLTVKVEALRHHEGCDVMHSFRV